MSVGETKASIEGTMAKPLEFDGESDSLFQPFDRAGRRHMEYLNDRGTFADVPYDMIRADFARAYPALMGDDGLAGDFRSEAIAGSATRPADESAS